MVKLAILNTTILTTDGNFNLSTITLEDATNLFKENNNSFISAIGHDSTTEILNKLLETDLITTNRIMYKQEPGQKALCFKLNGRRI